MFYIHLKKNWPELFPGSDLRCITCSRHLDNLSRVSRLCLKLISFQTGIFSIIAYMCNKVIYPNPLTALFRVIPPLTRLYFKMVFSSTNSFVNPSFFPFFNICIYWYFALCAVSTVYRTDSSTYECSLCRFSCSYICFWRTCVYIL